MTTKNLTACNEANEREINSMVGKAMCAYANYRKVHEHEELMVESGAFTAEQVEVAKAKHSSEFEATIRCIEMFVRESIYEIQAHVWDRCAEEFGIEA